RAGKELDGVGRQPLRLEELLEGLLIEPPHRRARRGERGQLRPLIWREPLEPLHERSCPELVGALLALAVIQRVERVEAQHILDTLPTPAHEVEGLRIGLDEGAQAQTE